MRQIILFMIVTLISLSMQGQERTIKTTECTSRDYYVSVTYLTEGATKWTKGKGEEEIGVAIRAIIITSEIYDNLIIEKVTYGSEGVGKKIISKRKVDLNGLWTAFHLTGEISGIEFIKWLSWNSFEMKIGDKRYLVKNIDSPSIKVTQLNKSA